MATYYLYTSQFSFKSDTNKTINACLYFRYDTTETATGVTIAAKSAGIAFRKASASDPDSTFSIEKNSTATKDLVTPNGTHHSSTATRSSSKTLTATASGTEWNYQSFDTWDYTYAVTKGTSAQTVHITLTGRAFIHSAYSPSYATVDLTASGTYVVPALQSWTVYLNANGGTNGSKTSFVKYYNTTAYFPAGSESPTRSGWSWVGWGTSPTSTSPSYVSYSAYTANAGATFYAIWRKTLYLSYNANGGSGAPSQTSGNIYNSTAGMTFGISATKPTRAGYIFKGWSTSSSATSASYQPSGSIYITANTTLYAVWAPDPTLGVSGASTENTYTVYTSVNSEVTRQVKIYENGNLIQTADVKGNNSFTFTGKRPETSFTIRVDLLEGSTVIATKTITVATVNSDIVLTGSNSDSTYTSVKATASGMKASSSFSKTIEWQYALASSPNAKTTFYSETLGTNATSNTAVITGLIPGRTYNITAIYYVDGYQTDIKTIALTTVAMEGSLDITGRGISTVVAALKDLTAIPYDIKAKVSYKEATSSEWMLKQTHDIYANAQADILTTISALRASTTYDIKAEILRASDSALMATFTTQVTTKAYVPGVAPAPFIDDYIVVPHAKVAAIKWHVEGDMDGFTVKLWEIIGTQRTVLGTLLGTGGLCRISNDYEVTKSYALSVIDGNNVEHNLTESVEMVFRNISFAPYSAGDIVNIPASVISDLANSLVKEARYMELNGNTSEAVRERASLMTEVAKEAVSGNPIYGRVANPIYRPVMYMLGQLGNAITHVLAGSTVNLPSIDKGSVISSANVNQYISVAMSALEEL